MIERDEFSADPLNSSHWVLCDPLPGALNAPKDQWTLEGTTGCGEVRSEDFGGSAAASWPISGVWTGAIAAMLSLVTGFLFTFMVNDITGKSHQCLFWPVAGLYVAVWIAEQQRSRK
jgi:hypothetical protein